MDFQKHTQQGETDRQTVESSACPLCLAKL